MNLAGPGGRHPRGGGSRPFQASLASLMPQAFSLNKTSFYSQKRLKRQTLPPNHPYELGGCLLAADDATPWAHAPVRGVVGLQGRFTPGRKTKMPDGAGVAARRLRPSSRWARGGRRAG